MFLQRTTAVAVFPDHAKADRAVAELRQAGFRDDQIGVASRDWRAEVVQREDNGTLAGEGALAGALAGAGTGGLVALGILAGVIPAIGPVIAGGALAAILANAAGGAALGGLLGGLIGLGVPEDEASFYETEFKSGRTIVAVRADGRYDDAMAVMRRNGGYDRSTHAPSPFQARAEEHRTEHVMPNL